MSTLRSKSSLSSVSTDNDLNKQYHKPGCISAALIMKPACDRCDLAVLSAIN